MTSFTEEIRKENDPIFEAIFNHPFVQGIGAQTLTNEQLIHYVKQDFEYLNSFMKIYGLAISRCNKRSDIKMFNEQINFILNAEVHPHNNFCQAAGVRYEDLQYEPLLPTASHYIKHMLNVGYTGTLGEMIAVLLPCPWTYAEIGDYLLKHFDVKANHKFADWIHFYSTGEINTLTNQFCTRLDEWAKDASDREINLMKDHFEKSCQLELLFWEMAYTLEQWPVSIK